jgi:hypothetical protein
MGKKQEGAPPPHPHTVIMWVVGVLLTTSVALCGLFFKASAQTTTNIADGNIVSVPGNQNNVTFKRRPANASSSAVVSDAPTPRE